MNWPENVRIIEVGPRDGLQNEKAFVATEGKIELIRALERAGLRTIQATSFVHPKWVPQLADAEAVIAAACEGATADFSTLVPNERGYERALAAGVREVEFVVAVSDTFSRHNVNMGTEESFARGEAVLARAKRDGVRARLALVASFGCPYEGEVPAARVVSLAERACEAGADELSICDTNGVGNPRQVLDLFAALREAVPPSLLVAHFHDTHGRGLANVVAALAAGVKAFDASIGGLGGCPYCPGAAGNIATEDLVAMLHAMGIGTGVDLPRLLEAAALAQKLVGRSLLSHALVVSRGACEG